MYQYEYPTPSHPPVSGSPSDTLNDEEFWRRLRSMMPLGPSQYDLTSRCNLTCEGCLFFSGTEYLGHRDERDLGAVDTFFAAEAARGIGYGYFGGAEPSLAEPKLLAAARHIRHGVVFTNGTRRITSEINYRIHVSVWGRPERSLALRGGDMLAKQLRAYRDDPRAVFVLTLSAKTVDDIPWVADFCADNDLALTFNHYSPTAKYRAYLAGETEADAFHARSAAGDDLALSARHLDRARDAIDRLIDDRRGRILYSHDFNAFIHDPAGLYSDRDPASGTARDCGVLLGNALRHHNTDLSRSAGKCCTPNVSCESCRLYAQSFATALARATRDLRRTKAPTRLIPLWRLWCALFLNDPLLSAWPMPTLKADSRVRHDVAAPEAAAFA